MKEASASVRASHVNFGTSVAREELAWPTRGGRVMRTPKLHVEADQGAPVTPQGGVALATKLLRRFDVAKAIDQRVQVLWIHVPYHESDHVLAQALNLFAGGTCLEDLMYLQHDPALRRMLGACRLPDPTTAGDFLRRFESWRNPGALAALRAANDEVQERVWRALPRDGGRRRRRARKRPWAVVDVDSHVKQLYGVQKQGADFSYNGRWSYHPLLVSLAGTGECLAVRNRPGNVDSREGADEVLDEVLPRLSSHFERVLVRADSGFDYQPVRAACERHGAYFAFVGRSHPTHPERAWALPEEAYRPFRNRGQRQREQRRRTRRAARPGARKRNRRRQRAQQRGYQQLRQVRQWLAETTYQPHGCTERYRLIIRRQLIEHHKGQCFLFDEYRYRFVVTNLPATVSARQVVDLTYERCDQENVIEQMGSGLAAWRMPVAEFDGNSAWLEIARLAWNLAKWIAQLALPAEAIRWEWKRLRRTVINIPAQVVKRGRQLWVRFLGPRRLVDPLLWALDML